MEDLVYESLLNKPHLFKPQQTYNIVEISTTQDGDPPHFRSSQIPEHDVSVWAKSQIPTNDSEGNLSPRLSALCLQAPRADRSSASLACSQDVYRSITQAWRLPREVLRVLMDEASSLPIFEPYDLARPTRIGLVLISGFLRIVVICHIVPQWSVLLIAPLSTTRKGDLEGLWHSPQDALGSPAYLPLLCLEKTAQVVQHNHASHIDPTMSSVRTALGLDPFSTENSGPAKDDETGSNLVGVVKRLTNLSQVGANVQGLVSESRRNLETIEQLHSQYKATLTKPVSHPQSVTWYALKKRLDLQKCGIEHWAAIMGMRECEIQALTQTLYSLIAVRDNNLNYRIAEASLRSAEDSRKVAILARQDSTDMRVIAGATLVFLPATFVATLFSSGFFQANATSASGLVSKWIWLYFVVASALTAVVMFVWRYVSRARDKETARLLHLKDPELVKGIVDEEQTEQTSAQGSTSGIALQSLRANMKKRNLNA